MTVTLTRLPHSGLQVPHDRFTIDNYTATLTGCGVEFTADLLLDGKRVGSVGNRGDGERPTSFHPTGGFDADELDDFAAQCRDAAGEPVTVADVLEDLIDEGETNTAVARIYAAERTPVRRQAAIVDGGEPVDHYPAEYRGVGTPSLGLAVLGDDVERIALTHLLALQPIGRHDFWEVWTGPLARGWWRLPTSGGDEPPAEPAAEPVAEPVGEPVVRFEHDLILTDDDKYAHLKYAACACGNWSRSGAAKELLQRELHAAHVEDMLRADPPGGHDLIMITSRGGAMSFGFCTCARWKGNGDYSMSNLTTAHKVHAENAAAHPGRLALLPELSGHGHDLNLAADPDDAGLVFGACSCGWWDYTIQSGTEGFVRSQFEQIHLRIEANA